jgi:hypothetical protein
VAGVAGITLSGIVFSVNFGLMCRRGPVTEPLPLLPAFGRIYGRLVQHRWFFWCSVALGVCILGGLASRIAGWREPSNIAQTVNAIWSVGILAMVTAGYYRVQPDTDWSNSSNGAGHAVWKVGRWLAKAIPPLMDDSGALVDVMQPLRRSRRKLQVLCILLVPARVLAAGTSKGCEFADRTVATRTADWRRLRRCRGAGWRRGLWHGGTRRATG